MRIGALVAGLLAAGLAVGTAYRLDAAESATGQDASVQRAAALIRQLGDNSYIVRQRAAKQLVEIGIAAQPQLNAALKDGDAEVRFRAGQVLGQIVEADFRARLEAFANDPDGKQQHALPSWGRFSQTFGDSKAARALFVEMQRSEPGLLETLEADKKLAAEMFEIRMTSIMQSIQFPQLNGGTPPAISLGTVCTILFVSSSEGVAVDDQDAIQVYNLIHQGSFQTNLRAASNSALLKKLLGMWIVHNNGSAIAYQNLMLAFNFDLQEGLDLAIKLIGNDGGQPFMRQYVVLAIGRFGNHEHIPLLEPLLKDTNPCMPQPQQTNDPKQSQIRDVTLAVLIKLSGQELKDYGLSHVQTNQQMLFQPGSVTFGDPAKRDAALAKWHKWAQTHVEKPAGDEAPAESK